MNKGVNRSLLSNLALLLASSSLAFVLGEVAVRVLTNQAVYPGRALFTDSPQFDTTSGPEVRYISDDTIRMVAVYGHEIEFDVTFTTNNQGFVDDLDYPFAKSPPPERAFLFVGDSFAAGMHGETPWLPTLRESAWRMGDSVAVYNLGVEGTGFLHFADMLSYADGKFPFGVIVILTISDDFRRPNWVPMVADSLIYMCFRSESAGECRKRRPYARTVPGHLSHEEILEVRRRTVRRRPMENLSDFLKRSHLIVSLVRQTRSLFYSPPDWGRVGLQEIVGILPEIPKVLLHVPQRNEVRNGKYDIDLGAVVEGQSIQYVPLLSSCDWDPTMYYPRDSHLNQEGYDHLRRCVADVLGIAQMN